MPSMPYQLHKEDGVYVLDDPTDLLKVNELFAENIQDAAHFADAFNVMARMFDPDIQPLVDKADARQCLIISNNIPYIYMWVDTRWRGNFKPVRVGEAEPVNRLYHYLDGCKTTDGNELLAFLVEEYNEDSDVLDGDSANGALKKHCLNEWSSFTQQDFENATSSELTQQFIRERAFTHDQFRINKSKGNKPPNPAWTNFDLRLFPMPVSESLREKIEAAMIAKCSCPANDDDLNSDVLTTLDDPHQKIVRNYAHNMPEVSPLVGGTYIQYTINPIQGQHGTIPAYIPLRIGDVDAKLIGRVNDHDYITDENRISHLRVPLTMALGEDPGVETIRKNTAYLFYPGRYIESELLRTERPLFHPDMHDTLRRKHPHTVNIIEEYKRNYRKNKLSIN